MFFSIVNHNHVRFLERFGKFIRVLPPGLHLFPPLIYKATNQLSLQEQISHLDH